MGPNNAFGPIFIAAAPPVTYFIDYNYIYTINVSWIKKKKKKTQLWPKQCQMCYLGLFSLPLPLPLHIS